MNSKFKDDLRSYRKQNTNIRIQDKRQTRTQNREDSMKTPNGIWVLPDQPKTLSYGLIRCIEVYFGVFICSES